ncbi:MAG TPA: hypothetical protein ENG80_04765, partial [Nitrospirae bacterium]|nr:hypothetical protein [Nitrospirota bacterium]
MKPFWQSKTLLFNVIAFAAILLQTKYGFVIGAEEQAAIIVALNVILRFITRKKITMTKPAARMLSFFFIIILFAGCAHTGESKTGLATRTLVSMKETVIGIAEAADQLCSAGYLTQDECDQVNDVYQKAMVSYDLTADSLIVVIRVTDKPEAAEKYRIFHDKFLLLYQDIY